MRRLQGACYVLNDIPAPPEDGLGSVVIGGATGARHLAQRWLALDEPMETPLSVPGAEMVMFVAAGSGEAYIAGRPFELREGNGAYVAPGEAFRLNPRNRMRVLVTICPEGPVRAGPGAEFDRANAERVCRPEGQARERATAERWYQRGIGPRHGARQVTQFLGHIPPSKAPEHFHLYEEALYIIGGEGRLWNGEHQAPVSAGSIVFLPVKQRHCLECTSPGGMTVHGVFYPAGSPADAYD